jgi:hypothetical protein
MHPRDRKRRAAGPAAAAFLCALALCAFFTTGPLGALERASLRALAVDIEPPTAGGIAAVAPQRSEGSGDDASYRVGVCAVSYADALRNRALAPPPGWAAVDPQAYMQSAVPTTATPGQQLYYRVFRPGEGATFPAFGVRPPATRGIPAVLRAAYDCVVENGVSPTDPIHSLRRVVSTQARISALVDAEAAQRGLPQRTFYTIAGSVGTLAAAGGLKVDALRSGAALSVADGTFAGDAASAASAAVTRAAAGAPLVATTVAFNPEAGPAAGPFVVVEPEWSDAVADGAAAMNVRFSQSLYLANPDLLVHELEALGIRHVSAIDAKYLNDDAALAPIRSLSAAGVDVIANLNVCDDDATIDRLLSLPGVRLGGVTYPNEIDRVRPAGFDCTSRGLRDYGSWIGWWDPRNGRAAEAFARVRRDRPDLPILSQTFGGKISNYCAPGDSRTDGDCEGIGDTSRFEDIVNVHSYTGGNFPLGAASLAHEQCGPSNTLYHATCLASFADPEGSKPRWFGERGYNNVSEPNDVIAAYLPVDEMVQRLQGFSRYYFFNLVDGPSGFTTTGLLTKFDAAPPYQPKPQYWALMSFIAKLADPGPRFSPGAPLAYGLRGTLPSDFWYLTQKRDGDYVLMIANVVSLWSKETGQRFDPGPHSVTLSFPFAPANATIETYDTNPADPEPSPVGRCEVPARRPQFFCLNPPRSLVFSAGAGGAFSATLDVEPELEFITFRRS